jgi:hypothetical protein
MATRFQKVILDGVLVNHAVAQINWTFVLSLVDGKGDASEIVEVAIGHGVPQQGKKGSKDYRPAVPARSLTCWHCTQRGQNFAVFYRRISDSQIRVIGYGAHTDSNTRYKVDWSDGSTSRIDLNVHSKSGAAFLV